jgi:hypothetical protein
MRAAVTIREERDPVFWQDVADHPQVRHVNHGHDVDMAAIVEQPTVVPLASQNGGFLFFQRDWLGGAYELHTMFRPEGWRREAHDAGVAALVEMFGARQAAVIFTYATDDRKSRPPKTFGFEQAAEPRFSAIGEVTPYILTAAKWFASPAWRRACH